MEILIYVGYFFVLLGSVFLFLGALGIYRMPDVYNRLQAGTKSSTLGAMSTLLGIGILQPDWMVKMVIIIIFIAISNPLSSHALARGAYRADLSLFQKKKMDAYKKESNMEDN